MKRLAIISTVLFMFTSCDVRKKDKAAQIGNNELKQQKVIKNPTTVSIIDSVFDFGKVTDGEIVTQNFRFVNSGKNPLIISKASASCGCTVPEKPEAPIATGDTGYIKVKFNSAGRVGMVHKNITVEANTEAPFPDLLLKGEVIAKKVDSTDQQ
jgi:Protein of unknown function (DUF1573)